MPDRELLSILDHASMQTKFSEIHFYAPSFMYYRSSHYCSSPDDFPTISVTGGGCALNCKHCGAKVLETMHPVTSPEELFELCRKLKHIGASGCLISGGCLPDGSVPISRFAGAIGRIKHELGLTILVHTGMVDVATARALKQNNVDCALIDVIGSDDTVNEICNLSMTVNDYASSLKALDEAGLPYVPHVTVGLHYGKLKGELQALRMIQKYNPSALVIIAFMPIPATEMQNVRPPMPLDIARVIAVAKLMFPRKPLVLGCMRPKGRHRIETDVLALKAGVDAIAFPTEEAIRYIKENGCRVVFSSSCCSQAYADLGKFASSDWKSR